MPRSLGSVYGGSVTRFLGGSLRGVVRRVIDTFGVKSSSNGIAVSRDGSTLLVSDCWGRVQGHTVLEVSVADGSLRRVVGGFGDGPLQFNRPRQVWIADDGFVFVADCENNRVQVLTPTLDFHGFVGMGAVQLARPTGVCANSDVVVVSEATASRISVFSRRDGALLRRFGSGGVGDVLTSWPLGLCFMPGGRHVAVAEESNHHVNVFSVDDGELVRTVGVGVLHHPRGVACSAFGELVVADTGNHRVVVLSDDGRLAMALGYHTFSGVAMHGSVVCAVDDSASSGCVLFE
jgi:DNA-binding beta-propeller fold protein YncE